MLEHIDANARMRAIIETVIQELWSQGVPEAVQSVLLSGADYLRRSKAHRKLPLPHLSVDGKQDPGRSRRSGSAHSGQFHGSDGNGLYNYHAPTASMTVSYCRPIPIGVSIVVRVKVTSCSRTLVTTSAELVEEATQRPLLTAVGTYCARADLHPARLILP